MKKIYPVTVAVMLVISGCLTLVACLSSAALPAHQAKADLKDEAVQASQQQGPDVAALDTH